MSQQNNIPASFYKNFSTETLESMLRDMTLSEQALDMDQLDAIMAELDHRTGAVETMPPEEAWKMFRNETEDSEPTYLECAHEQPTSAESTPVAPEKNRKFPRLMLLAAIIVVLVGVMVVSVTGGADVLGAGKGSSEKFTLGNFFFGNEEDRGTPRVFVWPERDISNDTEFSSLQECLDALEIDFEIAEPSWLPDGFEFSELTFDYTPEFPSADFHAVYTNTEGESFAVTFYAYTDTPAAIYEKTDAPVEEYTVDGITYYAMSNTKTEKVVWMTDHFECCIYGSLSRETIKEIVSSIKPVSTTPNDSFFVSSEELSRQYNEKHIFWPEVNVSNNAEFASLQEALDTYEIDFEIAEPRWLPDGYEMCQIEVLYDETRLDITQSKIYFYAAYKNNDGDIIGLTFRNCEDDTLLFSNRIDTSAQCFTTTYGNCYKSVQGDYVKIMWTTGHFDGILYGNLTDKEWLAIVESITPQSETPDDRFYASQADLDKLNAEEKAKNEEANANGTYVEENPAALIWDEAFVAKGTEFSCLQECLVAHGITAEVMAPEILPDGYTEKSVVYEYSFASSVACFKTTYENEDGEQLVFSINRYSEKPSAVYDNTETYMQLGSNYDLDYAIHYYLIKGEDCQRVIWLTENFEYEIVGPLDCEIDNFWCIANTTLVVH